MSSVGTSNPDPRRLLGPVRAVINPEDLPRRLEQLKPPLRPLLEPITFSTTEMEGWRRCRRGWALGSYNQYSMQKLVPKVALDFGSIWHRGQEAWVRDWYAPGSPRKLTLEGFLLVAADIEIERVRKVYLEQVGAPLSDVELDPLYTAIGLGQVMAQNYQKHWGAPLPTTVTLIEPEQKILTPIPGTFHCTCILKHQANPGTYHCPCAGENCGCAYGSAGVQIQYAPCGVSPNPFSCCEKCGDFMYLEGKLDGICRGTRTGKYFVLERKTLGAKPKMDALQMNNQFLHYHYILERLTGNCGGVFYDGALKADEYDHRFNPPKKTKALSELFLRHTFTRADNELAECELFLTSTVLEMSNPNMPLTINRRWDGCWDCDFERLCTMISRGEDYGQTLQYEFTRRIPD